MAKGAAAVLLALAIVPHGPWPVLAALAAVLGHVLSPFAGFRGGKGVATAGGAILVLAPVAAILVLLLFALIVAATRIVSLGSMAGAVALPIAVRLTAPGVPWLLPISIALAVLVLARHRANLGRLLRGAEPRIAWRGEKLPSASPMAGEDPNAGAAPGTSEWSAVSRGAKE